MPRMELETEYVGKRGPLFRLAFVSSLLTVLTLGIYRFWMKTRLRRYYWSSIRPGGHPLEYFGEPLEKLLGFLIAVVFLSFYIGIVNLVLMFFSFSLFQNNFAAYAVSFVGILPIWFFARYRARRYILARTRWRGIRFGLEPGAWGYAWRALIHWAVTICTLGLLWPRMAFWLEKYRTDRTYYGSQRFVQGGSWTMLYSAFLPLFAGLVIMAIGGVIAWQSGLELGVGIGALGGLVALYGIPHFSVHSFRLLANAKTVGGVGFVSRPKPWRVIRIYSFGYFLVSLVSSVMMVVLFGAFGFSVAYFTSFDASIFDPTILGTSVAPWLTIVPMIFLYFLVFIAWGVLTQVFVTLPLSRHYAETLSITGAISLGQVSQRDRDEFAEAEGFAEALDIGAAI